MGETKLPRAGSKVISERRGGSKKGNRQRIKNKVTRDGKGDDKKEDMRKKNAERREEGSNKREEVYGM